MFSHAIEYKNPELSVFHFTLVRIKKIAFIALQTSRVKGLHSYGILFPQNFLVKYVFVLEVRKQLTSLGSVTELWRGASRFRWKVDFRHRRSSRQMAMYFFWVIKTSGLLQRMALWMIEDQIIACQWHTAHG